MRSDTITVTAPDGTDLFTYRWVPDGPVRAIVQIAHGMAEHAARYERFARALTHAGYAVYANDHRGHGHTAAPEDHGYFADRHGWRSVVDDLGAVTQRARSEHPDVPVALFGHSMGSFLARAYAAHQVQPLDALVLSGTAGDPGLLGMAGRVVAGVQARLRGRRHTSGLMDMLSFGQYNAAFKPNRTPFDWLSRDETEVDAYVADPLCGNVFTAGFYGDLLAGLAEVNSDDLVSRIDPDLPILLVSGDADPVGDGGAGVRAVADQLSRCGVSDVTCTLYPEARHEILNETNRDEVEADILAWLEEHLPTA